MSQDMPGHQTEVLTRSWHPWIPCGVLDVSSVVSHVHLLWYNNRLSHSSPWNCQYLLKVPFGLWVGQSDLQYSINLEQTLSLAERIVHVNLSKAYFNLSLQTRV